MCRSRFVFNFQHVAVLVEGQLLSEYEVYVVEEASNPGKILALEAFALLDNFTTVLYCGLRVHKVLQPCM